MKLKKKSSPLKLLSQSQPNFAEMILGWSPFKLVSVSAVLYPKWPPLLKIEISSNGQNCSILSQKVPKFELYKHNDELFNIYYGIFLWTLNFSLFWPIMQIRKKGGWNLKKILLRNNWANCNQTFVEWSFDGPLPKLCPMIPTSNHDGRQVKNRNKGGEIIKKILLLWNYWANLNQTLLKWSSGGPLSNLCPSVPSCIQNGHHC